MNHYPLIKINIIFIIGILIQNILRPDLWIVLLISTTLLILGVLLFFLKFNKVLMIVLMLLAVSAGSLSYNFAVSSLRHYPFSETKMTNSTVYGTITDIQPEGYYELKFRLHADSIITAGNTFFTDHNFICRIRDTLTELKHLASGLSPGNYICLNGTISKAAGERNPGEFNYYDYLYRENISALFTSYNAEDIRVVSNHTSFLKNQIFIVQKRLSASIEELLGRDAEALLKGLILADRSGIDQEIINDFINSGVIHILSVSGLHIGYIVLIFIFLTGRINFIYRVPFIIIGVLVYTAITGAPPSVLRASVMCVVIFIALLSNRSTNLLNTLSFACLLFLIYNPLDLFHPGFQLSYMAVGAIALFYHYYGDTFKQMAVKNKILSKILVFFLISFFAQAGTLPFIIFYFGKVSIVSLLANIFVIPAAGVILGAGIFMLIVNIFWSTGALLYASAINFLVYLLYSVVHLFSSNGWSYLVINHFSIIDAIIFYTLIIILLVLLTKFSKISAKLLLISLVVLNIVVLCSLDDKELLPENHLSIIAIDVGQGDAFLVKFPNGKTALIDAGESNEYFDNGKKVILPLLEYLGIRYIDYGFISHMDSDHYKGFISLLKEKKIRKIYKPELVKELREDQVFEKWLRRTGIPIVHYEKEIMCEGNARIYIIIQPENFTSTDMNNNSGVFKIVYGNSSILFMGDTEKKGEGVLISNYASFLKSDVLKLGHHGSKGGTGNSFLDEVKPTFALISAGANNRFNHPSPETLARLRERRIKELRIDLQGTVVIKSDGEKFEVINWKN